MAELNYSCLQSCQMARIASLWFYLFLFISNCSWQIALIPSAITQSCDLNLAQEKLRGKKIKGDLMNCGNSSLQLSVLKILDKYFFCILTIPDLNGS